MNWIKCSDKLPEYDTLVLGYVASKGFYTPMILEKRYRPDLPENLFLLVWESEEACCGRSFEFYEVTYWMPLPAFPDLPDKNL